MITAQQAYEAAWAGLKDVDESEALSLCEKKIQEAVELNRFTTYVGPFSCKVAEKAAIILEQNGYAAGAVAHGNMLFPDGNMACGITINFKFMPANTREAHN